MGPVGKFAVGTIVVVGIAASSGSAKAEKDAQDTAAFIVETSWNAVQITTGALVDAMSGERQG